MSRDAKAEKRALETKTLSRANENPLLTVK